MKKIPTLFRRDGNDRRYVTQDVTAGCEWVLAGEGIATRKYDGTCVMFDGERWWARREVKPGKRRPEHFSLVESDPVTGKDVGWEPLEQSGFARWHAEALADEYGVVDFYPVGYPPRPGTYELVGPKINGNPEKTNGHLLVRHGYRAAVDERETNKLRRDFDSLAEWLRSHDWEGIVWHHPDGRMAKLKARDFPKDT